MTMRDNSVSIRPHPTKWTRVTKETSSATGGLGFKLSIMARAVRQSFDERAKVTGLTRAQWRTLAVVKLAGGATQKRVALLLEVSEMTAGRAIDRLCELGLLERRPDPNDRRANRVMLGRDAGPILAQLDELSHSEEARMMGGLDPEEQLRLHELLDRVLGNLRSPWLDEDDR
jgi:DNA-binding MarR family transcriptional regulator